MAKAPKSKPALKKRRKTSNANRHRDDNTKVGSLNMPTDKSTSFLDLPAEIRVMIYEPLYQDLRLVSEEKYPFVKTRNGFKLFREGGFCLNLLQTNKIIYEEVMSFLKTNLPVKFKVSTHYTIRRFVMAAIPYKWKTCINVLELRDIYYLNQYWPYEEFKGKVSIRTEVYHFQGTDRPERRDILYNLRSRIYRNLDFYNQYSWRRVNRSGYKERLYQNVWYFNTQPNKSSGIEVEMHLRTWKFAFREVEFTKIPFDERRFKGRRRVNEELKDQVRTEWNLSADGWKMEVSKHRWIDGQTQKRFDGYTEDEKWTTIDF